MTPSDPFEIRDLPSPADPLFPQAVEILQAAFGPDELETPAQLAGYIRPGSGTHFWVAHRSGNALGVTIFTYFCTVDMGFIPYLAVHPTRRGGGLGSLLLARLAAQVAADGPALAGKPARGVFFEVDAPEAAPTPEAREICLRRIRFYERSGASLIPMTPYWAPPLRPGLPEVPYRLMLLPLTSPPKPLSYPQRRRMLAALLRQGYHLSPSSRSYRRALASLDR